MGAANPTAHAASRPNELYSKFNHVELPLGVDGTPFAYYEALRDVAGQAPIGWSEAFGGFWVAAGYDACREIMRRPREFSNDAVVWPAHNTGEDRELMIAGQDDPVHHRYRELVQDRFSPRAVTAYDEALRRMTNNIIDSL
ncbi:MAG: hypothetical protein L0H83_04710 [Salinisphaera sp.]|nr:hypothetical protein [Salinisphaera sp.]